MTLQDYKRMRWGDRTPIPGEDGLYHQLIEIRNLFNHRIYICIHSTDNPNDDYMGSGAALGRAYQRWGKAAFAKRILHYAKDQDELRFYEQLIVDKDFIRTSHTYNRVRGGGGRAISTHREHQKNVKQVNKNVVNVSVAQPATNTETQAQQPVNQVHNDQSLIFGLVSMIMNKIEKFFHYVWMALRCLI